MKALTVQPLTAGSARLDDIDEPPLADGSVLVETLAVGVCGTDIEITSGAYGWAPPGRDRLVLGHESLGRVLEAPAGARWPPATWWWASSAAPTRCPAPTAPWASGTSATTASTPNGGSSSATATAPSVTGSSPTSWSRSIRPSGRCGVLLEPTSVVAKAWEQVDRIGGRAHWAPTRAWSPGPGPSVCWPP